MKKPNVKVLMMSLLYIFILMICRGVYLYVSDKKTPIQSLFQVGVEVGNFAVIAVFGFAVAFAFISIGVRLFRKTKKQNNTFDKTKERPHER
jgi:cytochrome bd-type quinol oxidase subunit 2